MNMFRTVLLVAVIFNFYGSFAKAGDVPPIVFPYELNFQQSDYPTYPELELSLHVFPKSRLHYQLDRKAILDYAAATGFLDQFALTFDDLMLSGFSDSKATEGFELSYYKFHPTYKIKQLSINLTAVYWGRGSSRGTFEYLRACSVPFVVWSLDPNVFPHTEYAVYHGGAQEKVVLRAPDGFFIAPQHIDTEDSGWIEDLMSQITVDEVVADGIAVNIDKVRIGQVVWDPSLNNSDIRTLVLGKSAAIEATISSASVGTKAGNFRLMLMSQGSVLATSNAHSIQELAAGPKTIDPSELKFVPGTLGDQKLTLKFIADPNLNVKAPTDEIISVSVRKTYTPTVGLVPIGRCEGPIDCYGTVSSANFNSLLGLQYYLSDMFPVPDNTLILKPVNGPITGSRRSLIRYPKTSPLYGKAYQYDTLKVSNYKHIIGLNRLIGILPKGYFAYSGAISKDGRVVTGVKGVTLVPKGATTAGVSLVEEDYPGALAHELTHGFGDKDEYYVTCHGCLFDGYNSRLNEPMKAKLSVLDDNKFPANAWMDRSSYLTVFPTFLKQPVDPKTVLVAGMLNEDGTFSVDSAHTLENGVVSESVSSGEVVLKSLDSAGMLLSSVSQASSADVFILSDNPSENLGAFETKDVPVVAELPYSPLTRSISIELRGKKIASICPQSQSLITIIAAIPDSAFLTKPDIGKKLLFHDAEKVEDEIAKGHDEKAARLVLDLALDIEFKTRQFNLSDGSNMTKQDALSTVTSIARDLN